MDQNQFTRNGKEPLQQTPRTSGSSGGWRNVDLNNAPLYGTDPKPAQYRQTAEAASGSGQRSAARKKKRKAGPLPPWLLVLVCHLYYTFLFHLCLPGKLNFGQRFAITLFALGFGMLSALLATVSKKRWAHTLGAVLVTAFWAVMFLMEFFIHDAFQMFYTAKGIFGAGAENAGQSDFAARTMDSILGGFWLIVLFILPIAAYFLINRFCRFRRILTRGIRRYLAICGGLFIALALLFSYNISADSRLLTDHYQFTDAVKRFGLPYVMLRDIIDDQPTGDPLDVSYNDGETHEWDYRGDPSETDPGETANPGETVQPGESGETAETGETEPVTPERPKPEKEYNVMQIDFQSLIDNASSDRVKKVHQYVYSLRPSKTNDMTGLFKGKNLIFISAEGFAKELIDPDLTPTLYRLATKGIHFTDYYQPAWGGSTSTGEFSNLTGIEPADAVQSIKETIGHNMYLTMGNQLMRLGYFSRAYHNNDYTYYGRDKTHENLGYEKFIGMGNGMEEGVKKQWPESDQEMIDYTVPLYIDKQPFSIYYMTVSGHGLYSWQGNSMSYKHKDEVQDLPYGETLKAFFACNLEVEYAMRDLVQMLEDAGIADDTVIVLATDHYPYCLEKSDAWGNPVSYLEELYGYPVNDCFAQDHNGLIIWSGCIEDMGLEVTTPVYSLDIVPTLSNLFGVDYDSRLLVGRDVFSDQEPLVLWPNCSWITDKGRYNARTNTFTPVEGVEIPDGYVDQIDTIVRQKIRYSKEVLDLDYFATIFGKK